MVIQEKLNFSKNMNNPNQLLSEKIDQGLKKAFAEAVERHRKLGEAI